MSSHREAPGTAKDPVADSTDLYAFVSPKEPDMVTLIANYVPLELPNGGPNFFEFGDDVLYEINVDNDGDAKPDVTYQFRFKTELQHPNSFLYNVGQITPGNLASWNRRQFYSVTRVKDGNSTVLAAKLACPPCNVGPRSTPNYAALADTFIYSLGAGKVFAGQRAEGFYVDLGSIFDLGDLRPFQSLHLIKTPTESSAPVNATEGVNVHSIAIQVPKKELTRDGTPPTDPKDSRSTIGVWTAAFRRKARILNGSGDDGDNDSVESGPWVQVSRLGNPLFNEVIVPMGKKDLWNSLPPAADSQFLQYVQHPELAKLLPILYPGVFPNLAALTAARADLVAILLTGIPAGVVAPAYSTFTGTTPADMLRLNMAIGPTTTNPSNLGVLGGDLAGFPNGRRVFDDVVTIELRAIAGVTYPLVATYTPDGAAALVTDGSIADGPPTYLTSFPYLGVPHGGYQADVTG